MNTILRMSVPHRPHQFNPNSQYLDSQVFNQTYHPITSYPSSFFGRNEQSVDAYPISVYQHPFPKSANNITFFDLYSLNYKENNANSRECVNISMDDLDELLENKVMLIQHNLEEVLKKEYSEEIKYLKNKVSELETVLTRKKVSWYERECEENENIASKKSLDSWASSVLMKLHTNDLSESVESNGLSENSTSFDSDLPEMLSFESPCKKQKLDLNGSKILKFTQNRQRKGNLPEESTKILKKWLYDHKEHAYPNEEEKVVLKEKTNLSLTQINNWFTNARRRILKGKENDN